MFPTNGYGAATGSGPSPYSQGSPYGMASPPEQQHEYNYVPGSYGTQFPGNFSGSPALDQPLDGMMDHNDHQGHMNKDRQFIFPGMQRDWQPLFPGEQLQSEDPDASLVAAQGMGGLTTPAPEDPSPSSEASSVDLFEFVAFPSDLDNPTPGFGHPVSDGSHALANPVPVHGLQMGASGSLSVHTSTGDNHAAGGFEDYSSLSATNKLSFTGLNPSPIASGPIHPHRSHGCNPSRQGAQMGVSTSSNQHGAANELAFTTPDPYSIAALLPVGGRQAIQRNDRFDGYDAQQPLGINNKAMDVPRQGRRHEPLLGDQHVGSDSRRFGIEPARFLIKDDIAAYNRGVKKGNHRVDYPGGLNAILRYKRAQAGARSKKYPLAVWHNGHHQNGLDDEADHTLDEKTCPAPDCVAYRQGMEEGERRAAEKQAESQRRKEERERKKAERASKKQRLA